MQEVNENEDIREAEIGANQIPKKRRKRKTTLATQFKTAKAKLEKMEQLSRELFIFINIMEEQQKKLDEFKTKLSKEI